MGSKSTTTQKADPWTPAQAGLKSGIGDAQNLYASGGFKIDPYQGDWVADPTSAMQRAQNGIMGLASQGGLDFGGAINAATNVANQQYTPNAIGPGMTAPNISTLPVNAPDITTAPIDARIKEMNFDPQRQRVIDAIMPAINNTFAGSGMTGSSLHQQNLAAGLSSGLADAEMGFRNQQLAEQGQNFGQQLAASNQNFGQRNQNFSNQMAAQGQNFGQQNQNFANQMAVHGQNFGQRLAAQGQNFSNQLASQAQQLQAAGMLPGMLSAQQQAQYQPYEAMMGVGQQQQAQNQAEIDALIQKDMLAQGADANALQQYMALMSGVGGQFGSQTSTQTQRPGVMGVIGGGLQMASMFGG